LCISCQNLTGHTHSHTTRTNAQDTNEHTNEQNGKRRNDRLTVEDAVAAPKIVAVVFLVNKRKAGEGTITGVLYL